MSETTQRIGAYEPSVRTVEMVCDRLAELGLAIGPDTARALVREVLAAEGPRIDARLRESLDTALQTIKVAAQSAMGLLATSGGEARAKEPPPAPEQLHVSRRPPPQPAQPAQPAARKPAAPPPPPEPKHPEKRPSGPRRPRVDFEEEERRPMFRRPGRR
jgi:type IV secretory pathway VirB10-like protein